MVMTSHMQKCVIEVRVEGKLIGYVSRVSASGDSIVTYIDQNKCYFPALRSNLVRGCAQKSTVCIVGDAKTGMKFYPAKDMIKFKIIRQEDNDESDNRSNFSRK